MPPPKKPPLGNSEYQVGWICALPLEMTAARAMLDELHEGPEQQDPRDHNNYCLGRIQGHNIVIACLPDYGTNSAAIVAEQMLHTFKEIRFGLMVGIGGGVPSLKNDIRLGDIVVSRPEGTLGGVVQYDLGKAVKDGHLQRTGSLDRPPPILLSALCTLESNHDMEDSKIPEFLKEMAINYPQMQKKYMFPGSEKDRLFKEGHDHPDEAKSCDYCDLSQLVDRKRRDSNMPAIHYGLIACGNQVMRNGLTRSRFGKELGVLCFEMEAAGLMNHFKCLAIRGICDYSDSHKNKDWQHYAATTAAAYAKELLLVTPVHKVQLEKPIVQVAGP
jgi:nucleoside phosphorylase